MEPTPPPSPPDSTNAFVTTRWTRVVAAQGDSAEARQALSDLCAAYYAPVVAFLRHENRTEDAARELAHEFFARVLERSAFDHAHPQRGRFRSYLLGALKHFLANRRAHERRDKRGAGAAHEPITGETDTSPGVIVADPAAQCPDTAFDRAWALRVLERVFIVMQEEADAAGSRQEYETLKPWLTGEEAGRSPSDAARKLSMNEGALRVAIHRLRRRFRELVKAEIAQTVNDPHDVADELRHLIAALST